jgi:hypothetical protein
MHLLLGLLLLSAAVQGGERAAGQVVYASLPLRDLAGDLEAARRLQDRLQGQLERRGAAFAPGERLEAVMRARRIRYTDSLGKQDAAAVAEATGARFLITGALLGHASGPDPHAALAVRVLDLESGDRVQSAMVSLRGEDFRGAFGLGAIEDVLELEREVVTRVVDDFDASGRPVAPTVDRRSLRRARPSDPLGFHVDESFDPAFVERLVVMPLANGTRQVSAGVYFAEILSHELFRSGGAQVVELSELRNALNRARVRSLDTMDGEVLRRIGRDLGTRYFVLGRLETFTESTIVGTDRFPAVEASIRILDVETGRIAAAASVERRGDDYRTILGLGVVRDLLQLADRTAHELVALLLG